MNQFLGFYTLINIILYYLSINKVEIMENLSAKNSVLYEQLFWLLGQNFNKKMHADFVFALLFGIKNQMYYKLTLIIKNLYLWPLFSLNSLHYYLAINTLKKIFKISKRTHILILSFINFLNPTPSIFRTFLDQIKIYFKLNNKFLDQLWLPLSYGFMALIGLSHTHTFSFFLSFIFIIAYKKLKRKKRIEQFIHFLFIQLLISIYLDFNFSFAAFLISILLIFIFIKTYFYLLMVFLVSSISKFNVLDQFAKYFILILNHIVKFCEIDRTTSPLFLLITLYIVLKTRKLYYLIIFFILKSDFVFSPEIIFSK